MRQRLVDAGLIDVEIAPGMTVPSDLSTCIAVRSRDRIESVVAEHPEQTTIESLGERNGRVFYRVKFRRLGENILTLNQVGGRATRLEFFATEPLETLIHKRAAFITQHQMRDASKWYNGLLAEWAMDTQVQLGPDNYDRIKGWRIYEVTCDDPGLSKPAYLSSKNAEFPIAAEVEALDYYIEHFVWGGLQRTTEESYSYGIYGIPDWKQNRDSSDPGSKGKLHIWRCYDYPHIVVMYFSMYKIARDYPGLKMKLDKATYLERAYGTALGMFTIPMEVTKWSAYRTGFYNEVVIPQLIEELDLVGKHDEAAQLRMHWEKKVAFFVSGGPNLFGSEYAFDSTGFESTQAIARYALDHPQTPGTTPEAARNFAETQIRANLFCRGVVEKAYYYYGSDYRAGAGDAFTLTYMSPMGGWGVLDHALHDRREPDATVRLGFASILSSWSLMNTGTQESGFGYWFPSEANDGGTGGGFEPAAYGMTWLGQPHHRGPWYYSSETDLGYCGALRAASTIVADDPVFGRFCFGGELRAENGIPADHSSRRSAPPAASANGRPADRLRADRRTVCQRTTNPLVHRAAEIPLRVRDRNHWQWRGSNRDCRLACRNLQGDLWPAEERVPSRRNEIPPPPHPRRNLEGYCGDRSPLRPQIPTRRGIRPASEECTLPDCRMWIRYELSIGQRSQNETPIQSRCSTKVTERGGKVANHHRSGGTAGMEKKAP